MPEWNMVGKPISTAEMASTIPAISQRFRLPSTKAHSLLQGVGLGVIIHNATYDAISLELWSDRAGSPSKLIATSVNSWTKAEVDAYLPLEYKFISMGFEFTPISLRKSVWYHLAIRASTYTGNTANHIAWKHSYPDIAYQAGLTGIDIETIMAGISPLEAMVFAAEF